MKKIISLVLLTMIILSSLAFVYAAWICDCGGYVTLKSTSTGAWNNTGSRGECPHGNIDHNPVVQKRTIVKTYKCDSCSVVEEIVTTETRVYCR